MSRVVRASRFTIAITSRVISTDFTRSSLRPRERPAFCHHANVSRFSGSKFHAPPNRLAIGLHQAVMLLPHSPVMIFHEQPLPPAGPNAELVARQQELPRRNQLDRRAQLAPQLRDRVRFGKGIRLREHEGVGSMRLKMMPQAGFKRRRLVDQPVIDYPTTLAQLRREVPHRAVNEHELKLVIRQRRAARFRLDHQHARLARLRPPKRRVLRQKLITENPDRLHAGCG